MKKRIEFLDVDFIGGLGSLSKEDELKLSEYFKNKKKAQLKKSPLTKASKSTKQKA